MVTPFNKPTIENLKEIKLLQIFSDQELNELLSIGEMKSYEPHSNIIIEGELSWGLYLNLDGVTGVYKANKLSGNLYDIGQLRSGSFFGEMSLVDEGPRSATVRALTECHTFYLSKENFIGFLSKSPDRIGRFYQSCIKILVERLRDLDDNYVVSQYQLWKTALSKDKREVA